jgi:RNA polymerase sigma-70 factor (ECF subfamily)
VAVAEDITQECFLALLGGARFEEGQGKLRTYLFGIARHYAWKHLRQDEREVDGAEADDVAGGAPDALSGLLSRERSALVERAVMALPPLQREALILFEYEDLALEEIAAITGIDAGAVKSRLHRARQTLRRSLACERSCP